MNINQYINSLHGKSPSVLAEIEQNNVTGKIIYPILGAEAGRFLYCYILAHKPKQILELGTGCAYATIYMALAAKTYGGKIISIENNANILAVAKKNISKAKCEDNVTLCLANAEQYVQRCRIKFDLILQDTYPQLYSKMLSNCINILNNGKVLITHDALVEILNAPPQLANDMSEFNTLLSKQQNLSSALLPMNDGLWLSIKK